MFACRSQKLLSQSSVRSVPTAFRQSVSTADLSDLDAFAADRRHHSAQLPLCQPLDAQGLDKARSASGSPLHRSSSMSQVQHSMVSRGKHQAGAAQNWEKRHTTSMVLPISTLS